MHEVSLVEQLLDECTRRAAGRPISAVRVRHASSVSEGSLRQAFAMLSRDGPLAGARLEAEQFEERLECECGFNGVLDHDDVMGPVVVCPQCGDVTPRSATAELALVEVRLDQYFAAAEPDRG